MAVRGLTSLRQRIPILVRMVVCTGLLTIIAAPRLLPATPAVAQSRDPTLSNEDLARLLLNDALTYYQAGLYAEAAPMARRALELRTSRLGDPTRSRWKPQACWPISMTPKPATRRRKS